VKLEDYTRHIETMNQRLTDPVRRKLHIQYVGKSEHGGCHVTVFVMGTWFQHIWISEEGLKDQELFEYLITLSLRNAITSLIEETVKLEAKKLREDLDKSKAAYFEETGNDKVKKD
jgi:hypothetical protein